MAEEKQPSGCAFRMLQSLIDTLMVMIVFTLAVSAPPSTQAQTYTVLHTFTGMPDGLRPYAGLILDAAGNLYGTTQAGGAYDGGSVFKLDTTRTLTTLYSFCAKTNCTDGGAPYAPLIRDSSGNLYGTTAGGGGGGSFGCCGTVFKVDPAGNESVLRIFNNGGIGGTPHAGLFRDSAGNLYGTTVAGGAWAYGTVFKLDPTGKETVLHSFKGSPYGTDGTFPYAGLIRDAAGNFYGAASEGGVTIVWGAVYKLDQNSKETVLYSFTGNAHGDGGTPDSVLVRDPAGNLYGTTSAGGTGTNTNCGGIGCGTVFKLDPTGKETVLYSFTGGADGSTPYGGLVRDAAGNLYGTTSIGGATTTFPCNYHNLGCGVIFKLDPTGKETVLHAFIGSDGAGPFAGLILDAAGNLYGTTLFGGTKGDGVVFKLTLPNFKIKMSPSSATVSPGQSATSTLTITPVAGLTGTVNLGCTVPSGDGLSCSVLPTSVTLDGANSETANLTIDTSSTTPAATDRLKAKGISGAIHHCATFTLTVQ